MKYLEFPSRRSLPWRYTFNHQLVPLRVMELPAWLCSIDQFRPQLRSAMSELSVYPSSLSAFLVRILEKLEVVDCGWASLDMPDGSTFKFRRGGYRISSGIRSLAGGVSSGFCLLHQNTPFLWQSSCPDAMHLTIQLLLLVILTSLIVGLVQIRRSKKSEV